MRYKVCFAEGASPHFLEVDEHGYVTKFDNADVVFPLPFNTADFVYYQAL